MGYRIELWTEHEDNGAAIHALATRVGDDSLTLTSGEEVPTGEWVAFEVKLADGSVFLEGMGRCQASLAKEPLWDIELGMLQLETRDQMLFERIQLAAEDLATGARATGEVDVAKLEEKADEKKKAAAPAPPPALAKPIEPERVEGKTPPALPKQKWPWQKATEPGMPSPDQDEPPKKPPPISRPQPPPPVSKPPPPVSKPPPPVSKPPPLTQSPASPPTPSVHTDAPIPAILRQRLMNLVPNLVAEGRVRDLAGAHELALRIGLQALETLLDDED